MRGLNIAIAGCGPCGLAAALLLDARALARGLEHADSVDEGVLRRRHVLTYSWSTALSTPVYQSNSRLLPLIREHLVGRLSKLWPGTAIQASMVARLAGNPLRSLGLEENLEMARPAVETA